MNKRFEINGRIVEVCTIKGLATIVGKSVDTIKRYERTDILPPAIFLHNSVRYYPVAFCHQLRLLIDRIPVNKPCPAELKVEITKLFNEERSKYASKKEL